LNTIFITLEMNIFSEFLLEKKNWKKRRKLKKNISCVAEKNILMFIFQSSETHLINEKICLKI